MSLASTETGFSTWMSWSTKPPIPRVYPDFSTVLKHLQSVGFETPNSGTGDDPVRLSPETTPPQSGTVKALIAVANRCRLRILFHTEYSSQDREWEKLANWLQAPARHLLSYEDVSTQDEERLLDYSELNARAHVEAPRGVNWGMVAESGPSYGQLFYANYRIESEEEE